MMNELEKSISDEVRAYVKTNYAAELVSVMLSKDDINHFSVAIDSMTLFDCSIAFAHYLFQSPRKALILLDDVFREIALCVSKTHPHNLDMLYKENLHARLVALPHVPEIYRTTLPNCSDVGQFICISGTVIRASGVSMLEYKKLWHCNKCKYQFIVTAEVEYNYLFEKPKICSNPEWCNGTNFTLMSTDINKECCKDYQEIKVQEQVYNLTVGTVPRSIWVILEDDLVETCHAGNDVNVSGVVIQRWKPLVPEKIADIDLVLFAHNIEVKNKMTCNIISKDIAQEFGKFWLENQANPLKGRDFILSSICPQVFGMYIVKLAVALVLAGGVQKKDGNSRIRGDSHLLLIGDPGTAKSQFLKFASRVSARSVLTSGIGTTNAGLTVSAVKDGGKWQLEAGALVLADGGICCIDEFSCIKEQDKTCIHEAMEQQTISVAKAGLVCSVSTRCSILAVTNPKGKYDGNLSLSENTALGSPLLSRFDIILVLLDMYDEKWDEMVSAFILEGRNALAETSCNISWPVTKMKNYFSLIRYINPKVTPECERVLQAYYRKQRSLQMRNTARTTPRLLQSLIRLAEGHARLMFRHEVLIIDAIIAIVLVESSMLEFSILEGLSSLQTIFPESPNFDYQNKARTVLRLLELDDVIQKMNNYGDSYQEITIRKILFEISGAWNSRDPFEFDRFALINMRNHEKEKSTFNKEMRNDANDAMKCSYDENEIYKTTERSEDLLNLISMNKMPDTNFKLDKGSTPSDIYENFECNRETNIGHSNQLKDDISTLSDLKNIFSEDLCATSTKLSEKSKVDFNNLKQSYKNVLKEPQFDSKELDDQFSKELRKPTLSELLNTEESVVKSSSSYNNLCNLPSQSEKSKRKYQAVSTNKNTENPSKCFSFIQHSETAGVSFDNAPSDLNEETRKQGVSNSLFAKHTETLIINKVAPQIRNELLNSVCDNNCNQDNDSIMYTVSNNHPLNEKKKNFDFSKFLFKNKAVGKRKSDNLSSPSKNLQNATFQRVNQAEVSGISNIIKQNEISQEQDIILTSNPIEQPCNAQSCFNSNEKDKISNPSPKFVVSNNFEKFTYKSRNVKKEIFDKKDYSIPNEITSSHETCVEPGTSQHHLKQQISSSQPSQIYKKIFGDSKAAISNLDLDLDTFL